MKKRIISAIVALIISIPLIYKGGSLFYIYAILISLIGLREILNLIVNDNLTKIFTYIIYLSIITSNLFKINFYNIINPNIVGIIFLMFSLIVLINNKDKEFDVSKGFSLLGVTLFLAISFSIMIINRNISLNYFIYLLLIPIINDTFAYIIGSKIGKHKITSISPKKSYEGSISGLIFSSILCSLFYILFVNIKIDIFKIFIITLLLSILGQIGDLFFSLIKRNFNIKDYSNIMPGHGGVLDRLDSVIFVMLASTFIITLL